MNKILSFFAFGPPRICGRRYPEVLVQAVVFILALMFLFVFAGRFLESLPFRGCALRLLANVFPFEIAGPVFIVCALKRHNRDIPLRRLLDLSPPTAAGIGSIVSRNLRILAVLFPAVQLLNCLTAFLLTHLGCGDLPRQRIFDPDCLSSRPYCLLLVFSAVFLAPAGEELLFRHLCCNGLHPFFPTPIPQVAASAAFAAVHCIPQAFPSLFLLAVVLQKRKEEDGLAASVLLHGFYNLAIFLVVLAGHCLKNIP